ncbi:hypothetical protein HHK36_032582 [Tetracentron sinense]|uniref:Uncharacterized protein n=1 Tax=Tetracentron sinense TaxID=13715 RepID=A0A834Y759_TETSI|nr:hypothetical protein HHK36_032582 [Tetracentron sinense]
MSESLHPRETREEVEETTSKQSFQEQTLELQTTEQNHGSSTYQIQEWETRARTWLSMLPKRRNVTMAEMEAWIDSKEVDLPEKLKSWSRSLLYQRIVSIHKLMRRPYQEKEDNHIEPPQARFQRTDQWIPVYSWLELLDKHEVVKSKEISDFLSENPKVEEQLYSRHSRYHLMHYIKKCHLKVLKRRAKQKGVQQSNTKSPMKVHYNGVAKQGMQQSNTTAPTNVRYNGVTEQCMQLSNTTAPTKVHSRVPLSWNSSSGQCKDNEIYIARRNEAFLKYEMGWKVVLAGHGHALVVIVLEGIWKKLEL